MFHHGACSGVILPAVSLSLNDKKSTVVHTRRLYLRQKAYFRPVNLYNSETMENRHWKTDVAGLQAFDWFRYQFR